MDARRALEILSMTHFNSQKAWMDDTDTNKTLSKKYYNKWQNGRVGLRR